MAPTRSLHIHFCSAGIFLILILTLRSALASTKPPSANQEANHKSVKLSEENPGRLVEPNKLTQFKVIRSHEQHHFHLPPTIQLHGHQPEHIQVQRTQNRLSHSAGVIKKHEQFRPIAEPHTQATMRADVVSRPSFDSQSQTAQSLYPPFFHDASLLDQSRPYFNGRVVNSLPLQLPLLSLDQQQQQLRMHQRGFDGAILGSGDFGVLRGGTYYPEEDTSDYSFADANIGHGRPSEAFIQKYTNPEEQFANFRDFADINMPADSAFSQFVVVYAAKNGTRASPFSHPKNIFDQLELLDTQSALAESGLKKQHPTKIKTKILKTKLHKKYKKKIFAQELEVEPLLALS